MPKNNTVDTLIEAINNLSNEQLTQLATKIRTTPDGIKAYSAFVFGSLTNVENVVPAISEEGINNEA